MPTGAASVAAEPNARTVIARVRAYVDGYLLALSAFVAEEATEQRITITWGRDATTAWRADFAVVRSDDGGWLGLRDMFDHNGRPVAARGELTSRLFSGDRTGIGVSARRIADASAQRNLGQRYRNLNTPVLGLELLGVDRRSFVRTRASRIGRAGARPATRLNGRCASRSASGPRS